MESSPTPIKPPANRPFPKSAVCKTLGVCPLTLDLWLKQIPRKLRMKRGVSKEGLDWLANNKLKLSELAPVESKTSEVAGIILHNEIASHVEQVAETERMVQIAKAKQPLNQRLIFIDLGDGKPTLARCKTNRVFRPLMNVWVRKDGEYWAVVCSGKHANYKLERFKKFGRTV
jgi:hypothetical protein